jgi:hypothetical protein
MYLFIGCELCSTTTTSLVDCTGSGPTFTAQPSRFVTGDGRAASENVTDFFFDGGAVGVVSASTNDAVEPIVNMACPLPSPGATSRAVLATGGVD